jgi:hypothetical protein
LNPPFSFTYANTYFGPQVGSTTEQGLTVLQIQGNPYANEALRVWDPNVQPARVQQWNATIEHQLPAQTTLSVGYVGQHGTHLMDAVPYAQKVLLPNGTVLPSLYLAGNPQLSQITTATGTKRMAISFTTLFRWAFASVSVTASNSSFRIHGPRL